MIQKPTSYIYSLFLIFISIGIYGQNLNTLSLTIQGKNKIETNQIASFKCQSVFTDKKEVIPALENCVRNLIQQGYYSIITDSLIQKDQQFYAYLNLGSRLRKAIIVLPKTIKLPSEFKKNQDNTISIPINKLTFFLNSLRNEASKNGQVFATFSLENNLVKNKNLYAELKTTNLQTRKIDSIIVKGYENFPKNYLNNYYRFKKGRLFNKAALAFISKQNQALPFASEIKAPEVLFSKDSTLLYMYLKKEARSSFDGMINFSSKEGESGIAFNGYLNVALVNVFNRGEELTIHWNNSGQEKQSFKFGTTIPYLFNSKISGRLLFTIYKNDSTYLNTNINALLTAPLNQKTNLGLYLESGSSKDLLNTSQTNIKQFQHYFIGTQLNYESLAKIPFHFQTGIAFGSRKTEKDNTPQYKVDAHADILIKIGSRTELYLKNETAYLASNSYLQNELYRLGGINSFRGFKEASILAFGYSFINTEFRYYTLKQSFLYSILDIGVFKQQLGSKNLSTLGLGYVFRTNENLVNLSYTYGVDPSASNSSFLNIKLLTYF